MLKSVVLPAPLGPMRLAIIPASRPNSMALTAIRPPKALLTLRASRSAMLVAFFLCLTMEFRGAACARKQTLRAEQHDDDQGGAEEEPAPELEIDLLQSRHRQELAKGAYELRRLGQNHAIEQQDDHATDDHASDIAHASENHHAEQHDRHLEAEEFGENRLELGGKERPPETGKGRPKSKGHELGADGIDAHAIGGGFILANGHPGAPETG